MKKFTFEEIKNYLENKITNNWYKNSKIDYDIDGKFLSCDIEGHRLNIYHEEEGKKYHSYIAYFEEYEPEELYNIWMEDEWQEVA